MDLYEPRLKIDYMLYQPQKPKNKEPIDENGNIIYDELSIVQKKMLGLGEDIIVTKPIHLKKSLYKTVVYKVDKKNKNINKNINYDNNNDNNNNNDNDNDNDNCKIILRKTVNKTTK